MGLPRCPAATSSSGTSFSGRSPTGDALASAWTARPFTPLFPHRNPGPRPRDPSAGSAQTRHFNTTFDPSKSNIPEDYNFAQPLSIPGLLVRAPPDAADTGAGGSPSNTQPSDLAPLAAEVDVGPYIEFDPAGGHVEDRYWSEPAPEGSFMVGNAIAQRTRLTPLRVPESGAGSPSENPLARVLSPFPREEYYAVEMDLNYGREWPRLVWEDGTFAFRPGFLGPAVDPRFAPYWLHRGLARFQFTKLDRAVQVRLRLRPGGGGLPVGRSPK
ncbi:hypothetical protein GPECTOR_104g86 [Gonium pectorale]|uniref:Uncharacterized protein n=1 Tax=Gonium pectorale TaxID=33097 RepID=A0A150G1B6_GONPE|nr:hypothetical protein GPECTOR_104g86 [Gonium pectorale]|eukprot:KXZ43080.1 hypothetical protein GPECTOR_104g86 [Gonium pectorale]